MICFDRHSYFKFGRVDSLSLSPLRLRLSALQDRLFAQRRHQLPGAGGPGGGVCAGLRERLQGAVASALHLRGKNWGAVATSNVKSPHSGLLCDGWRYARNCLFYWFYTFKYKKKHLQVFASLLPSRLPSSPASSRLRVQYPAAPESPSREATWTQAVTSLLASDSSRATLKSELFYFFYFFLGFLCDFHNIKKQKQTDEQTNGNNVTLRTCLTAALLWHLDFARTLQESNCNLTRTPTSIMTRQGKKRT